MVYRDANAFSGGVRGKDRPADAGAERTIDMDHALIAEGVEMAFAGLIGVAGFAFFRHKGNTVAEAGAYGLMVMVMLHSFLAQVLLYAGWQHLFTPLQALAAAAAAWMVLRHHRMLTDQAAVVARFGRAHWPAVGSMLLAWGYLGSLWVRQAGHAADPAASLAGSVWLDGGLLRAAQACTPGSAIPVLNQAVLLSPWQPATVPAIVNMAAYITIGLATYALARRYAWPPTAVTVSLLVVSMPRLAHQSLAAYSELIPAAAALMVILALYRAVEQPNRRDVGMTVCALTFCVAGGRLCYVLPAVLAALCPLLLARRYDVRLWPQAMRGHLVVVVATAGLALVFSQLLVVLLNLEGGRSWIGELSPDRIAFNVDGLTGLAANMARYLLQSIQLPETIDRFGRQAFGVSGLAALRQFCQSALAPLFGGKGAAAAFDLSWASGNGGGWFGPVGFVLVLPSLVNAFWRGPYRLKTTALALAAYWILIALIAAWQPANVRLMTPFFAASGFTMAFFLPPWRLGRKGRLMLQLFGVVMLAGDLLPG